MKLSCHIHTLGGMGTRRVGVEEHTGVAAFHASWHEDHTTSKGSLKQFTPWTFGALMRAPMQTIQTIFPVHSCKQARKQLRQTAHMLLGGMAGEE